MHHHTRHSALEYELRREQAGALGIAGKQLQARLNACERYREQHLGRDGPDAQAEKLLDDVAGSAYGLLLQREFVGLVQGKMEWLQQAFRLPEGVLSRLGALPGPK